MAIKFIVRPVTSYGVFMQKTYSDGSEDSDVPRGTYESEKTAQCVAEALNDEAARVVGPIVEDALKYGSGFGLNGASGLQHVPYEQVTNGQDKETT